MRLAAFFRRLAPDEAGIALVEFAYAFPILLATYLASYVLSDMISCTRKVSISAREVADITSRYITLTTSDLTTIENAATQVIAPYNSGNAMVRVSEVQVCAAGYNSTTGTVARVVWSQAKNGTALTVDTTGGGTLPTSSPVAVPTSAMVTLPANMLASGSVLQPSSGCSTGAYFILGEVKYAYTPAVKAIGFGSSAVLNLYDQSYMSPRGSTSIGLS